MEKNKAILCISFLLLFSFVLVSAYSACLDTNKQDVTSVPCEAITRDQVNCSHNVTITYLNNNTEHNHSMTQKFGNHTCNFTFDYSALGDYYLKVRTLIGGNDTLTFTVTHLDEDYNDKWLYFYVFVLGTGLFLFIYGYKIENYIFTLLSGFLFMAFAITFITQGYPAMNNNTMNLSIILLTSAVGLYLTGNSALGLIKGGLG